MYKANIKIFWQKIPGFSSIVWTIKTVTLLLF